MTDRATALRAELAPIVESLGLSVYDLTLGGSERPTLAILVDRPGGVDLDAIEHATRMLSAALDAMDPLKGRYLLEVSSPGLERPLRTPEHFAAAIGEIVTIKTRNAEGHVERIRGTIVPATPPTPETAPVDTDNAAITVRTDAGDLVIAIALIEQARTVFEWGPAPKPGRGSRPGRKKEVAAR